MSRLRLFDLNPAQEEAVRATEGPVLILAGAGTGKTRVITARIAYLLANGADGTKLLGVTFTNKAANEMRERVTQLADTTEANKVRLSTFHSYCVGILRQEISKLGYKDNFVIYDEADQLGLLNQILVRTAARDEEMEPHAVRALISKAKSDPRLQLQVLPPGTLAADIHTRYQSELKRHNAVDFDDILLLAVQVLREHPEARSRWQARHSHIMVDEFQDTNRLQLDLISLLLNAERNICVVGDDDQSIYGWRGAEMSNILEFERHFPNPKVVKLEQNYRSTNNILSTANALIRHNPRRRTKNLWSAGGNGEKIRLIPLPDDNQEAEYVANEIVRRQIQGAPWEDFAVIFRMNLQARPLETQLRHHRVPYRLVGAKSFFDRREVKDLLAWLRVLLNPADDISLLRVINNPPRGISDSTVEKALECSIQRREPLWETLRGTVLAAHIPNRAREAIAKFTQLVDDYETRMFAVHADMSTVAQEMLTQVGYFEELRRTCKTAEEGDDRERNVRDILSELAQHQKSTGHGLKEFLDEMCLDQDWKKDKKDEQKGVTLITLHAAKGLEYKHVYIVGVEEGILPHSRSKAEGTLEEERRLLYVGITRARETLALTWCRQRSKYGQASSTNASSFLRELPPEFLETVDYNKVFNAPAEEKVARGHFSRMREMLGTPKT